MKNKISVSLALFICLGAHGTRIVTPLNTCIMELLEDARLNDLQAFRPAQPEGIVKISSGTKEGKDVPIATLFVASGSSVSTGTGCATNQPGNVFTTLNEIIGRTAAALQHDTGDTATKKRKLLQALENCAKVPNLKAAADKARAEVDKITAAPTAHQPSKRGKADDNNETQTIEIKGDEESHI